MGPAAVGAVMAVGAIAKGIRDRKEAKSAQKAAKKQRKETLGFAGSQNYLKNLELYRKAFEGGYLPALRTQGEVGALQEQSNLQAIDAEAGRRGMSGGVVDALRNATRASRSANYNEAVRGYQMDIERAARGEAGATSQRQVNASLGAPNTYVPRPGWFDIGADALSSFVGGYGGQQANLGSGSGWQYNWLGRGGGGGGGGVLV